VTGRQPYAMSLHLQPHSMQPVELFIGPWNQRSGVSKARRSSCSWQSPSDSADNCDVEPFLFCLLSLQTCVPSPLQDRVPVATCVARASVLPSRRPVAAAGVPLCLANQTRTHPEIREGVISCQSSKWRSLVQYALWRERRLA
jgi:hypothetical protein